MKHRITFACLAGVLLSVFAQAQSSKCLDAADEPHHQVVYESQAVRVLTLDLPRVASTQPYCYAHSYLFVITGEGRTSRTVEGTATYSHDWHSPEGRFMYTPTKQVIRNESITPFRAVIVETMHEINYDPSWGNYDLDFFPGDMGSMKPSWSVSSTIANLTGLKIQVAPGDSTPVRGFNHVLIAVSDLTLEKRAEGVPPETVTLAAKEVRFLPGGSPFRFVNTGSQPARFILVEF